MYFREVNFKRFFASRATFYAYKSVKIFLYRLKICTYSHINVRFYDIISGGI